MLEDILYEAIKRVLEEEAATVKALATPDRDGYVSGYLHALVRCKILIRSLLLSSVIDDEGN